MAKRCVNIALNGSGINAMVINDFSSLGTSNNDRIYEGVSLPSFITSLGDVVFNNQESKSYVADNGSEYSRVWQWGYNSTSASLQADGYSDYDVTLGYTSNWSQCWLGFVVDDETQQGWLIVLTYYNQSIYFVDYFYVKNSTQNMYYFIGGEYVPYTWTSVPAISGNNGQFRLNLAQIKDDKIGTYNQQTTTTDITDFTALPGQSDIRTLTINIPNNVATIIGYSGENKLKAYKTYSNITQAYTIKLIFEFANGMYSWEVSNEHITYNERSTFWSYLSFIEDAENEVAVCDWITYQTAQPGVSEQWTYNYSNPSSTDMQMMYLWLHPDGHDDPDESDDPYDTGSTDNGGEGGYPTPQDHLTIGTAHTKGGLELGFVTVYVPTETQLGQIAQFLWSDDVLENFKKYFNNFADNIIALYTLPYTPTGMSSKTFKVGNMESQTVGATSYITDRIVDIDMGHFEITPKWTSYLDYSPYTKFEIYLPYLGTHTLDTDEIMSPANMEGYLSDTQGCKLDLTYRLDLLTGNIVAYLTINGEIRYQFTGKCGWQTPLTGANYSSMIQSIITAGATLASTLALGGLSAPLGAGALGAAVGSAVSGTVMAQKPNAYRSGNLSGDVSMLCYDTPYLIRTMPNKPECKNMKSFTGYPSYKTGKLNEFSGFTICIEAHVDDIVCTEEERDKILGYLREGVII